MNPPEETKKTRLRAAPFIIAVLCFFMPFIQVSCSESHEKVASLTGFQLVTGTEIRAPGLQDDRESVKKVGSDSGIIAALVCAVAAAGLCFLGGRAGKGLPLLLGAAGIVAMFVAKHHFDVSIVKESQGMAAVDYQAGFMLTCLLFLVGAGISGYQYRQLKTAGIAPAPGMVPPPPPPPSPDFQTQGSSNLPPPPPPPSAQPAAASSFSMSPTGSSKRIEPATPVVRAPMSRGMKLACVGVVVALAAAAGIYWAVQLLNRYPGKEEVRHFLEQRLAVAGQRVADATSKPAGSSGAASGAGGFNLIGEWTGRAPDGTTITYAFQADNSVIWQVSDPQFRAAYPRGLRGKYSLHPGSPTGELDIRDLQDPNFSGVIFQGLMQQLASDKFKLDAQPSTQGPRPKTFGPDAIVFSRAGASAASPVGYTAIASAPAGSVQLEFSATIELTNPLYARVPLDQYMQQQGADPAVFRKIRDLLNGPNGSRIRDLAGVSGQMDDLRNTIIVKETAPQGQHYVTSGVINAVRQNGQWQLSFAGAPVPDKDAPVGLKLSDFRGEVLSTNQPEQAKKLNDTLSAANDTLHKLEQAQRDYQAQLLAQQQAQQQAAQAQRQAQQTAQAAAQAQRQAQAQTLASATPATKAPVPSAVSATPPVSAAPAAPSVRSGTVLKVIMDEDIDTSKTQTSFRAKTAGNLALNGGQMLPAGTEVQLNLTRSGNTFLVSLASVAVNDSTVPLNTELISIGTVTPVVQRTGGGATINISIPNPFQKTQIVIKKGQQYTFHQK